MDEPAFESTRYAEGESSTRTEQRRLRHVTDILIRNLTVTGLYGPSQLPNNVASPPFGSSSQGLGSGKHGRSSKLLPGPPGTRPRLQQRQQSRDDIDLHRIDTSRKRTCSVTASVRRHKDGPLEAKSSRPGIKSIWPPASDQVDNKGKGKAVASGRGGDIPNGTLGDISSAKIAEADENNADEDSDLVFGWMSSSTPTLTRSRSNRSIKSAHSGSSVRSSFSASRLFRSNSSSKKGKGRRHDSDSDEDEDSSEPEDVAGRMKVIPRYSPAYQFQETTPQQQHPHVSFRLADDRASPSNIARETQGATGSSAGLGGLQKYGSIVGGRQRSASRGSILSIASASSTSTIKHVQAPSRLLSEKEERRLRKKRQDNMRDRLLRSKITLSLPDPNATKGSSASQPVKPALTRSRTISLPLSASATSTSTSPGESRATRPPSSPFFVSTAHTRSMQPSFAIDPTEFLVSPDMNDRLLREQKLVVAVWAEKSWSGQDQRTVERGQRREDGTQKAEAGRWRLLFEWEIDLGSLDSIGPDPTLFPEALPDNTLILRLSNSHEYYTARLPAFLPPDSKQGRLNDVDEEESTDARTSDDSDAQPSLHSKRRTKPKSREDGNLSDPGPEGSLSRKTGLKAISADLDRDRRERERALARRRMVFERSMRETKMMQSYDESELAGLLRLEAELSAGKAALRDSKERIARVLAEKDSLLQRKRGAQAYNVELRKKELAGLTVEAETASKELEKRRAELALRRNRLGKARILLAEKQGELKTSSIGYGLDKDVYSSVQLSTAQRRAHLISELSTIFPIEPLDSGDLLFSICGVPLRNASSETSDKAHASSLPTKPLLIDDDTTASALGFCASCLTQLAQYLSIPLHYPLRCLGSRSLILDQISQIKGPKHFPLYAKGVDRYRFEYAVFLLNKDIEQLMLENGISVLDLRQTLPNLKLLLLTLSTEIVDHRAIASNRSVDRSRSAAINMSQPPRTLKPHRDIGLGSPLSLSSTQLSSSIDGTATLAYTSVASPPTSVVSSNSTRISRAPHAHRQTAASPLVSKATVLGNGSKREIAKISTVSIPTAPKGPEGKRNGSAVSTLEKLISASATKNQETASGETV